MAGIRHGNHPPGDAESQRVREGAALGSGADHGLELELLAADEAVPEHAGRLTGRAGIPVRRRADPDRLRVNRLVRPTVDLTPVLIQRPVLTSCRGLWPGK
jgi:hypothetical protein